MTFAPRKPTLTRRPRTFSPTACARAGRRALCGLLAAVGCSVGQAQTHADIEALSLDWTRSALQGTAELPLRMEVQIGKLDPRLRLSACARVEPYLPAGSRLWGRTRIGLRCLEGPKPWNVFLPVTVQAFGPAWVLAQNVRQGTALTDADAVQAEVDWAEADSPIAAQREAWVGREAARNLQAGQALRQNMLRAPQLFASGARVKVAVTGGGFTVVSSGTAMMAGGEGATVRVRMDNGRLVSGVVNAEGVVEVR